MYNFFSIMNLLKIMFLLLSFLLFGCRKTIEEDIVLMQSSPFKLNIDSLFCVKLAHDTFVEPEVSGKIKIVIFSDSTICSPCAIKSIGSWDHYIQLSQNSKGGLQLFFIFVQNKKNINSLLYTLKEYFFDYPVYVDTLGIFQKDNPHLSENTKLHTFLLDENNNVILVGNPTHSLKLKELYDKIIGEKLFVQ